MPTVRLTIDGMMCEGCASRVEDQLTQVPGVETATADEQTGLAEVRTVAGEGDADAIEASVEAIGYEVTGLQAT